MRQRFRFTDLHVKLNIKKRNMWDFQPGVFKTSEQIQKQENTTCGISNLGVFKKKATGNWSVQRVGARTDHGDKFSVVGLELVEL